jgi:acyl carrier protein
MGTTISSRTPEGVPNDCPVCHSRVCIEPSRPAGDAPCPNCGTLLWFVRTSEGMRFHESREIEPIRDRVIDIICTNLGVNREQVTDVTSFQEGLGMDSLDVVELVMELEEEFSLAVPDDAAEDIKTVGEVIDRIARAGP